MKRVGPWIVLFTTLSVPGWAQDDADSVAKSKIIAIEKLWNMAYKSGDKKALDEILDDQITLVNDDGSVQSKTAFLSSVKNSSATDNSHEEQVSPESISVRLFGTTAIATGVLAVKGTRGGKAYTRRERFVDTWVFRNGKWVCVGTEATPILH